MHLFLRHNFFLIRNKFLKSFQDRSFCKLKVNGKLVFGFLSYRPLPTYSLGFASYAVRFSPQIAFELCSLWRWVPRVHKLKWIKVSAVPDKIMDMDYQERRRWKCRRQWRRRKWWVQTYRYWKNRIFWWRHMVATIRQTAPRQKITFVPFKSTNSLFFIIA